MKLIAGEEYTTVEVNLNDFFLTSDSLTKVNYLIDQGIESNVAEADYDFSELSEDTQAKSENT